MEYLAVVRAMEQTAKEGNVRRRPLRTALSRRWAIEDIKSLDPKDIEIKRVRQRLHHARLVPCRSAFCREHLAGRRLRQDGLDGRRGEHGGDLACIEDRFPMAA